MLDVLNINAGHMKFDFKDEADEEKASKVIQDMLRMGYAIFIETDDGLRRVSAFDPKEKVYIVKEKNRREPRKFKAKTTRATGVGATAGG